MSTFSCDLGCLLIVLIVGLAASVDVPIIFDNNFSSIVNYTPSQLENISKQNPETFSVPPIHTPSNNETVINISGINKNNTNYLLSPYYSVREEVPVNSIGQDWLKYGNEYYDGGNYNKSIECYEMAIRENPRFAGAWYNKGMALFKLGRYEDGIKALDKALEIDPNYARAKKNRDAISQAIRQ
jgi:tetratricopeptide (TPR) repeat protein